MSNLVEAGAFLKEKVEANNSHVQYEINKSIAEDSHFSAKTRAHAAKEAAEDRAEEASHEAKAEIHKQKATH